MRHAPGYAAAVTTSYVAILAWTIASLLLPRRSDRPAAGERGVANGALVALVCAALVASLVASLAIAHGAALRGTHRIAAGVPILVLADVGTGDPATSNAMQALALVESLLLFGLYRALAGRRPGRTAPLVVGAATITPSLATRECVATNVKGLSEKVVKRLLPSFGCKLGKIKKASSKSVAKGDVISLNPGSGAHAPGTKVTLTVSTGKPKSKHKG